MKANGGTLSLDKEHFGIKLELTEDGIGEKVMDALISVRDKKINVEQAWLQLWLLLDFVEYVGAQTAEGAGGDKTAELKSFSEEVAGCRIGDKKPARYWVFSWECGKPQGGSRDMCWSGDDQTVASGIAYAEARSGRRVEVFDVYESSRLHVGS